MTSTPDKIRGAANRTAGMVKEGIGRLIGSDQIKLQGKAQELKGRLQTAIGGAKRSAKDAAAAASEKFKRK